MKKRKRSKRDRAVAAQMKDIRRYLKIVDERLSESTLEYISQCLNCCYFDGVLENEAL